MLYFKCLWVLYIKKAIKLHYPIIGEKTYRLKKDLPEPIKGLSN